MNTVKRGLAMAAAIFILAGLLLSLPAKAQSAAPDTAAARTLTKRLVGDYGYWSRYQTPPYGAAQIPYKKLTHINHDGVSLNGDGTLSVPDGFLEPALIRRAHKAGVKVMLLLVGDFMALDTPGLMDTAMSNLWTFMSEKGYDGVDIDWEYPQTAPQRRQFFALMSALRSTFPSPTYTISADVAPWGGWGYDLKNVEPLVDYFNIMMYDCAGPWTDDAQLNSMILWDNSDPEPWECQPGGSAQGAIKVFEGAGVAPEKLNMGMPYYGYVCLNVSELWGVCPNAAHTRDGNCDDYVITQNYGMFFKQRINKKGWETFYDPIALVPYMLRANGRPGFATYDDPSSTYYRTWYSDWKRGLGGTFMWSLDADYDGQSQDLLDAEYAGSLQPTE
jgi:chitinase